MSIGLGIGRGHAPKSEPTLWLLQDEFASALPVGSVNGSLAEPGPGTRTVVDTAGNKVYISSGSLAINGASSWDDTYISYASVGAWTAGRVLLTRILSTWGEGLVGFIRSNWSDGVLFADYLRAWGPAQDIIPTTLGYWHDLAIVTRASGHFLFLRRYGETTWALRWMRNDSASATMPVSVQAASGALYVSHLRIPTALWLPTPLASDGFGSAFGTTDGLGHAEGIAGGIGAGGSGKTWSNVGGTWSVSGGKAINTPTLGIEKEADPGMEGEYTGGLAPYWNSQVGITTVQNTTDMRSGSKCQQLYGTANNQTISQNHVQLSLTTGMWYRFSMYVKRIAGTVGNCTAMMGGTIGFSPGGNTHPNLSGYTISNATYSERYRVMRCLNQGNFKYDPVGFWNEATGDTVVVDDVSVKPLALSELISVLPTGASDVYCSVSITQASTASGAACPSGLVFNCDSASNPQNLVIVYINREVNTVNEYVRIEKCVNGTWASVGAAKYTYSAGASLVVTKSGSEYRIYYNSVSIGSYTISDASIVNNTLHGLFSTDASNSLDDYACYATGSGGEYAELDKWS